MSPSQPEPLAVRPAEPADAAAIARVHVTTWREAYRGLVAQHHLDGLRDDEFLQRWVSNLAQDAFRSAGPASLAGSALAGPAEVRRNWVGLVRGEVVGFGSAGPCRDRDAAPTVGEVYAVYVLPSAWGQGAGRALVVEAFGFLRGLGRTHATLWVLTNNDRARRFYESVGMKPDGAEEVVREGTAELHETRYRIAL